RIEKDFPKTRAASRAKRLRLQIEMPRLSMNIKTAMPPGSDAISINTRNLKKIYFRLYSIDPDKLRQSTRRFRGWSTILNYLNDEWLKKELGKQKLTISLTFKTGDKGDYKYINNKVDELDLKPGVYIVLVSGDKSFKIGSSLMAASFMNITELVLVGTCGFRCDVEDAYYKHIEDQGSSSIQSEGAHFYLFNAQSGDPVKQALISVFHTRNNKTTELTTDHDGTKNLLFPVKVRPCSRTWFSVDPLARS
ncbi:unnamed protein product, partial [marine sediment metagenome]